MYNLIIKVNILLIHRVKIASLQQFQTSWIVVKMFTFTQNWIFHSGQQLMIQVSKPRALSSHVCDKSYWSRWQISTGAMSTVSSDAKRKSFLLGGFDIQLAAPQLNSWHNVFMLSTYSQPVLCVVLKTVAWPNQHPHINNFKITHYN